MNTNKEFQIKRLGPDSVPQAQQLFFVLSEIFGDKPANASEGHVEKLLHNPAIYILAAFCSEEIVGGLTAYELPMYHADVAELYIYDIGVKTAFHRMGVARNMLDSLKANCGGRGIGVIFVDASEADAHAHDFYRATKASEENVIQFTYALEYGRRPSA